MFYAVSFALIALVLGEPVDTSTPSGESVRSMRSPSVGPSGGIGDRQEPNTPLINEMVRTAKRTSLLPRQQHIASSVVADVGSKTQTQSKPQPQPQQELELEQEQEVDDENNDAEQEHEQGIDDASENGADEEQDGDDSAYVHGPRQEQGQVQEQEDATQPERVVLKVEQKVATQGRDNRREPRSNTRLTCCFAISASHKRVPTLFKQFDSYDPHSYGLLVNVYDAPVGSETSAMLSLARTSVVITWNTTGHTPGFKSAFWWSSIDSLPDAEYFWFMDEDMLFDRRILAFDQHLTLVRAVDAVVSTPRIQRLSAKHRLTINGYTKELTGDEYGLTANFIEQGSFMIKSSAWRYFHKTYFVLTKDFDNGLDTSMCQVMKVHPEFGNTPCLVSLNAGLIHMDTRSMQSQITRTAAWHATSQAATKAYQDKLKSVPATRSVTLALGCNIEKCYLKAITLEDVLKRLAL